MTMDGMNSRSDPEMEGCPGSSASVISSYGGSKKTASGELPDTSIMMTYRT